MTSPKPISLTQVDTGDYAGPDPEPLVVVGSIPGGGGGGAVDSVNGKTGVVALSASDVGALPASTPIPNSPDDIGAATAVQGAKADTAVQPAALDAKVTGSGVSTIWKGTQVAYDAIATKDPTTVYVIQG